MSRCRECPYTGERACGPKGPADAKVVFVGEAPGREEEMAGIPFIGASGKLLDEILTRVLGGVEVSCFYTNSMACRPPEDAAPYLSGIAACRQRLLSEVNSYPRKLVVAMGNSAVRALTGLESVKITAMRGQLLASELIDAPIFPVFHPAAILRQKSSFHALADDLERAMGMATGRRIRRRPGPTTHRVATSWEEAAGWAEELSEAGVVSIDIETTGLDKRRDRIIAVGLCAEPGVATIVPAAYIGSLKDLLEGRLEGKPRFLYHNGRFDAGFLRNNGIEARVDEDTLLLSYCLDEQPGRHGLKQLSNDILGAPDYELPLQVYKKEHGISGDYSRIPKDILLPYLAMDVDYTLRLYQELMPAVFGVPALRSLYQNLLIPASDLLTEVERVGFWVDPIRIEEARLVLNERKSLALSRIMDLAARHWHYGAYREWVNPEAWQRSQEARRVREARRDELAGKRTEKQAVIDRKNEERTGLYEQKRASAKRADTILPLRLLKPAQAPPPLLPKMEEAAFNPGSPQQVRWMLRQWGIVVEATDSRTLEPFQEDSTFVQWLLEYRKTSKLIGTYVEGITKAISDDGRVHPSFNLASTVTGRLSSSEPNAQNVPRDPLIRGIFGAPRGRMLVEADFAQAELRVLAHLSGDLFLREVYDNDRDLHSEMAKSIFGEGFTPEQRTSTKSINFGICYGMSGFALSKHLKIDVSEAERMIEAWYARLPRAQAYLEACREAPRNGMVLVTPFGRHRRYGLIDNDNAESVGRESMNYAIQCLKVGTRVWTEEGYREIEKIQIGERVKTQTGFHPVLDVWSRDVEAPLTTLRVSGCNDVTFTQEHPVWTRREEASEWQWRMPAEIMPSDKVWVPRHNEQHVIEVERFVDHYECVVQEVTTAIERTTIYNLHVEEEHHICVPYVTHNSVASDLTLISAILLREPLAAMGAMIVNIVHDSVLVECDDKQEIIDRVATLMLATMRMVPSVTLQTSVPFDADAKYGRHWGVDSTKFKEVKQ